MRFWEKFSRSIYKYAARSRIKKIYPKLLEPVLAKALQILDDEMVSEIRSFVISQQTNEGGFTDRGGKTDLYYTLFGIYVAEALSVKNVFKPAVNYVMNIVQNSDLSGVYLYCGAILYSKLIGSDETTEKLRKQIVSDLQTSTSEQPEYSGFLGILALYYLGDFKNLQRIINQYYKLILVKENSPCPVVAANSVIQAMAGKKSSVNMDILQSFRRENGGFAALHRAPSDDLLSTGVALYALHFLEADIRLIKPDCLGFIDNLYDNGGFRSTSEDYLTDVEYTFYGLLALGSMC